MKLSQSYIFYILSNGYYFIEVQIDSSDKVEQRAYQLTLQ